MATKSVVLSDISGKELTDETHVTVRVKHPDMNFPVELDMSTVESAGAVSDRCHLQEAVILQTRQRLHVESARESGHR